MRVKISVTMKIKKLKIIFLIIIPNKLRLVKNLLKNEINKIRIITKTNHYLNNRQRN